MLCADLTFGVVVSKLGLGRVHAQDMLCSVPLADFGGWLRAESFIDEAALLDAAIGLPASPPTTVDPGASYASSSNARDGVRVFLTWA